ncbi:MAG: ATP-dependent helicase HrpB [Acidimicrobiales bacterium]|nr:ATP-dependent helicase HrpB [Acidimicrobiales bacterium]
MPLPPTDLPVEEVIADVREALQASGHAVLQAEPGAGKSTVIPLRLLDESWLGQDRVVVLEPRRVAARAAARRMASLLGEEPGQTVGWVTRDDRRVGPETRIEVVTEGVLTARLVNDPALTGVGLVIFDEFHERSLPGDTGLALALHSREHHGLAARLLVMSATLDSDAVAALLGGDDGPAPVVTSTGRTFPVEIQWRPRKRRDPLVPAVVRTVQEALRGPDDVLVFLPGVGEIRGAERELSGVLGPDGPVVLPLHGSLPAAEQDAALIPRASRRVVLATDLAETSLTVEGIGSIVDSGLARRPRHDSRTGMTALHTVTTSRASAEQRAGRAGRTGPGIAYRLWSKVENGGRLPFLPPAITEVELSDLVLDLAQRGITDPATVPFLDSPPAEAWADGVALLQRLGALDDAGIPTERGLWMARVPAHPRLARMVVESRDPWLACLLAALLEDRDVLRGRPTELPSDLHERLALVLDPDRHHPAADGRALRQVRDRAADLARRQGVATRDIEPDSLDPNAMGAVLAAGFPDRVARPKAGVRGRLHLIDGRSAKIDRSDPLADARGIVAVDLGGRPKEPVVNRAARLEATIDHLVFATPDLDATVREIRESWGVDPTDGGSHDGRGSRNVLLALGGATYLEVIGPDPAQPDPSGPRPFGLDDLTEPTLVTWAAGVPAIDVWIEWARGRGLDPGDAFSMSRTTPQGATLEWRLTTPSADGAGVLPFLIEWPGATPAATSATGCSLMSLELRHPDPAIGSRLREYAVPVEIQRGDAGLTASLITPAGMVTLAG